jgi:hypothetical protein
MPDNPVKKQVEQGGGVGFGRAWFDSFAGFLVMDSALGIEISDVGFGWEAYG